ncbi:MAG: DUF6156 family protein [Gammaproteobacteria bacterium]|nr:DUF6156 family protein [Gammaproteobacteria bacterium]
MDDLSNHECRYFVSYSGIKLPLKLVNPLDDESLQNRNTYYRGYFNNAEQIVACHKVVYGEIEQAHNYEYYENGVLKRAEISMGEDELTVLSYDEQGAPI